MAKKKGPLKSNPDVHCKDCDWTGPAKACGKSKDALHDLVCPECGGINLDTSQLKAAYDARGQGYAYGARNRTPAARTAKKAKAKPEEGEGADA